MYFLYITGILCTRISMFFKSKVVATVVPEFPHFYSFSILLNQLLSRIYMNYLPVDV